MLWHIHTQIITNSGFHDLDNNYAFIKLETDVVRLAVEVAEEYFQLGLVCNLDNQFWH